MLLQNEIDQLLGVMAESEEKKSETDPDFDSILDIFKNKNF